MVERELAKEPPGELDSQITRQEDSITRKRTIWKNDRFSELSRKRKSTWKDQNSGSGNPPTVLQDFLVLTCICRTSNLELAVTDNTCVSTPSTPLNTGFQHESQWAKSIARTAVVRTHCLGAPPYRLRLDCCTTSGPISPD